MKTESKEQRRQRMISEPLLPLIIKMAIPTMLGMMVTVIYNLADTFWVGQLDNKSMTAAIGVAFSFVSLIQALGFWFGYGSGNVMSRALGAKNDTEAQIISSDGVALAVGAGIILTLIGYPFARPFAAFLGGNASEQLLLYSTDYLKIMLLAIPFSLFSTTVYNQVRLCGNVKDAMIGLLIGMAANMILDPILIFGFQMSIVGAGWATLIGQVLSCVYFFIHSHTQGNIPVSLLYVSFKKKRLYHIFAGGAPNFAREGITGITSVALNQVAAGFGETVIAALTVSARIAAIGYMLMIGFGQGFQPICTINFGAKQYDRVKKAFWMTVKIGTALMIVSAVFLAIFAPQLAGLLSTDLEVIAIASLILRLQCISFPLLGFYAVSSMYMQNVGQYFRALLISISRQGIFYFPLLFLLTALWKQTGLYILQPLSDVISAGLAIIIIKKYRFPNVSIRENH